MRSRTTCAAETVPADPTEAAKLSASYTNSAIGGIKVRRKGARTVFDFGEWSSEVGSRKNPDGTSSFLTTVPGFDGTEFVEGDRTLTLRDGQHEYVFVGTATAPSTGSKVTQGPGKP